MDIGHGTWDIVLWTFHHFYIIIVCVPTSVWRALVLGALWLTACSTADLPSPSPPPSPATILLVTETAVPTPTVVSATASPTTLPTIRPGATSIPPGATATFAALPTKPAFVPTTALAPTARAEMAVRVFESMLNLPVAPYARFLTWSADANTGVPFATLDRAAYETASEGTTMRAFKVVSLENELLHMSFLPELGGRLYQVLFKPTNQSLFYNNPVITPSHFGPFDDKQNWWLAAGGAGLIAIGLVAPGIASADETVMVCDIYGDHVAPRPSGVHGIETSVKCPGNAETANYTRSHPPGGMAIWSTRATRRGEHARWVVRSPTGLIISSVDIPHMYAYGVDNGTCLLYTSDAADDLPCAAIRG